MSKWKRPVHACILRITYRQPQRINAVKTSPVRTATPDLIIKSLQSPASRHETSATKPSSLRPGASYPPTKTSKIDVDARPTYEPNGKPITEIDMDAGKSLMVDTLRARSLMISFKTFLRMINHGEDLAQT